MSLERLALKDFVIVRTLELDFAQGFTVFTGETGAGKSILVDALQLALGARADTGFVREGCQRCEISAEFSVTPHVIQWLEQADLLQDIFAESASVLQNTTPQLDTLLLRRQIDIQGKSRAWINGSPVSTTQLRVLGTWLLDIYGQHAWQSLVRPKVVREILDTFAKIDSTPTKALFANWQTILKQWHSAQEKTQTLALERERLQWQVAELEKLNPQAEEWAQINQEQQRLSHAQTLIDSAQNSLLALESDNEGQAAHTLLRQAEQNLESQVAIEPQFESLLKGLRSALAEVEDCRRALHQYLAHAGVDEERLNYLDTRIATWLDIARRLHQKAEDLPHCWLQWQEALQALDNLSDASALQAQAQAAEQAYHQSAQALSQARQKAAIHLAQDVTDLMQTLGMQGGRFAVQVAPEKPSESGIDAIGFLVAGHAGSSPKPLAKVASGGELSRIALAIAVTTSGLGQIPTLIFDEVDAGIGGSVAQSVGQLMQALGQKHQVLAVTHLPQVAAHAHQHFCVTKEQDANGAFSCIQSLDEAARVLEIARMLGGGESSGVSLTHAREMLGVQS